MEACPKALLLNVLPKGPEFGPKVRLPGESTDFVRTKRHDARTHTEKIQALGYVPLQQSVQAGQVGRYGRHQAFL